MKPLLPLLLLAVSAVAQWESVSVPTSAGLRGLSVVGEKVVWASGTGGTVIRTTDAGKTWSALTVAGAEQLDFRGIRAFDENTAVIISSGPAEKGQARIYRTTDGGRNWRQVFEEKRPGIFFDAIAFWDRKHGIVLSDPVEGKFALFATEDGGATWKQLPPAPLPAALPNEGAFAASNSCLVVQGSSNVWFATGGATHARVFRSHDRGKAWQVSETPMRPQNASSGIFSLAFANQNNGVAVGGDYQKPEGSNLPNVLVTKDGGKTWEGGPQTDPPGIYFSGVVGLQMPGGSKPVAVGTRGMYMETIISKGGLMRVAEENLNVVATIKDADILHIWAAGPKGTVLHQTMQFLHP